MRRAVATEEHLVASRIDDAHDLGLKMQEETLTEMLHLGLAKKMATSNAIRARIFNRGDEGINGADWLWIFRGLNDQTVPMFVQAKRWYEDGGYSLGQAPAPGQSGTFVTQRAVLIAAGKRAGARTAFAFYNPASIIPLVYSKHCIHQPRFENLGGVGLADAHSVDLELARLGAPTSPKVGKGRSRQVSQAYAWPLSCALFCWRHPQRMGPAANLGSVVSESLTASGIPEPAATDPGSREALEDLVATLVADAMDEQMVGAQRDSVDVRGLEDGFDRAADGAASLLAQFRPLRLAGAIVLSEASLEQP